MSGPRSSTVRRAVAGLLLALQAAGYAVCGLAGWMDPLEFFNVLLLLANLVLAVTLIRGGRDLLLGAGTMFLIASHSLMGHRLAPDSLTSGAMLMVSILVLYVGVRINSLMPARYWWAFVASYFALFFLFVEIKWYVIFPGTALVTGLSNAVPLLLLFLMGMAACARSLRLLAYFWALVLSFTFCQPYAWEALLLSFFVLRAVFSAAEAPGRARAAAGGRGGPS